MKRKPPTATFDTPSRLIVVEPIEPQAEEIVLVAPVPEDPRRDDDVRRTSA